MKAAQYFQRQDLCLEALLSYRKNRSGWPMSNKLALYKDASCAFNPAFDREQRQHYFESLSYLHWASRLMQSLMQNSYDGLMQDFASWARSEDGLQAADSSIDLKQCYATALDCIIIGAKSLELGK